MQRVIQMALYTCLVVMLSGCSGASSIILPTTTPAPTQVVPTATATFLPPPTVTSFPTATPRGTGRPLITDTTMTPGGLVTSVALPTENTATLAATQLPPTAISTPTAPPDIPEGVTVGSVLYTTSFQGWQPMNDPTAKMSFVDGQYLFEIGPNDAKYRYSLAVNQRNMYVQMEVTPKQCPSKPMMGYGLMFRYSDDNNYYLLTIFCDKSYTIGGKDSGSIFGNKGVLSSDLDPTSSTTHRVGVLARGDDYTLYFDKKSIGTFHDIRRQQGDVGIYAISQADEAIRVAFGNLKVWTIN
jgi:hypothetical protein